MSENREVATQFLKLASSGRVDEAYSKYADELFKHHNQYFKGDRNSLIAAMKESSAKMPNRTFHVKMVLEDGDMVMTYSHIQIHDSDLQIAVVHVMKFKNNRIIELWDIGQPISKDSPNENGMF
jgi:predicted SnoaL-like aldol condensation-catalyzing enzyme